MVSKNNHQFYQQKHAERKQRWGLRKLSVGVASVLLGTTFMLYSNHAVLANTVPTNTYTTPTGHNVADHQGSQTAADKEKAVGTTTNAEEEVVATNHQGTPQGQNPTQNTTNVDKKDLEVTPTNDAKTPATQNATNVGNEVTPANGATPLKKFVLAALSVRKVETPNLTSTDPKEASTSLPMSNQDIKLDSQPMLTEIINKPTDNWVYKNLKWYADSSTAKVKEILQNYTTNDKSGRYYFAGAANYNESYHVIYLLARSNNLNDNNLYVTILHTGRYKTIQEEVVAPGESKKVEYGNGTGGTTHTPIFTNYDGTSVSIGLDGVEKGDNNYGMVVGFAYGHDTGISGDKASIGNGFMTTPMPTKTTTTIHYIDQATGDELAVPKSFEGVAYQKYTITGEAPTIDGYTLKQSPKTTGYISPYKVGGSYDFRFDKHVVVKQTVINAQGLIRITAYYDGEAIGNTTKYLGNIPNVNDHFSFMSHGKSYTYKNQIKSTNDGIVYYYAKDGSEDNSEVRIHYIDVTGNKNSLFVPGDGKEVATDKISGKLGEKYNYNVNLHNVNLSTDYNLATNQANTVNGTYTIDHHDEYVYVVKKTLAEKITPKVPGTKEPVANTSNLTETEKAKVQKNVEDANKGNFPDGTKVTVGDDGTATITYPDQTDQTKSTDTIPGSDLVRPETDAEKITPKVPGTKEPVANTSNLTETEKAKVQKNVEDANKGNFPDGTKVTVGDDGTATITYPDQTDQTKSTDTIPGSDLVRPETDAEKITPKVPGTKEPVANTSNLTETEKAKVQKNVEDANKGNFPDGTKVTVGDDGTATITYPDQTDQTKSTDTIPGSDLVRPETDAEKITPKVPGTKEPVANTSNLTETEKAKVQKNVEDANKGNFPDGTKVTVGDDGTATITYPDQTDQTKSTDTIPGSDLVRPETDAEKITPKVPGTKEPVANTSNLTETEKAKVQKNVEDANKGNFPDGTKVTVGDDGTATITYPDQTDQTKSTDTIPGSDLVRPETDAEKITPKVPGTKEPVANTSNLTETEKAKVQKNVEDANKGNFPDGTKVTVGDDGTATITYPDQTDQTKSTDTIPGSDLVRPETDAEKITPKVPGTKEPVANTSNLTETEKAKVQKNVEDANKGNFPDGTKVTVGDDGTATITYPDQTDQTKSTDTIPGSDLVRPETDAEKITPKVPGTKEPVANTSNLTETEKAKVQKNVEDANKGNFPDGTKVTVGDDGTATITYPDQTDQTKSTDTIPGSDLVRPETDAEKITPKVPGTKEPVANTSNLTETEKAKVQKNVEDANKGNFPDGTKVTVGDDGTATITYPDQTDQTKSTDTIPGSDLVRPETDAEKITPKVPGTKEPVANTSNLTETEKAKVQKNVEDANKGNFPDGTKVTVGDDGTATITYPDQTDQTKSTDTIPGSDLVRPETDAEKITPKVPGTKEPVANTSNLTETEKAKVQKNVEDANKGNFPDGTKVTVGDDGTATITYPDQTDQTKSTDTIPGSDLVRPETDAEKITPKVPGTKEPVANTSNLTETEKAKVQKNVEDANKGNFPDGTKVTVGDDGTATITYPDQTDQTKSTDTIPGSDLVRPETDAEKITPKVPGTKEPVANTSNLTETEKAKVQKNVEDANKGNFPDGTKVTVGDDGTATITYPDQTDQTKSTDTIPGSDLVRPETDAEKITPKVPGTKEPVANTSNLTETEKAKVQKNVEDANKGNFPDGTKVTVGDDGTATITYPDQTDQTKSTDTIPGSDLVRPETDAEKITPKVPGTKEPVANTSNLTETEKAKVQKNVEDANKGNFPDGTKVTVGDDGTATITYPDQTDQTKSTDTIPGSDLVRPETDAEKITPKVPGTKEPVANTSNLTETEKAKVQKNVEDANKGNFPDGTKVTVGDDGTATITYPDQTDQTKSTDTIPGSDLVRPETDAEKITPKVPGTKEPVANTSNLTETEKAKVQKNVEDANKGNFPDGTKVTVGDDGTATITYPDQTDQTKSTDTIPGSDLVRPETDAEKITPKVPGTKEPVANTSNLTETEKAKVQKNVEDANKGNFPDGTKVTVGDDGTATITYPDQTDQTKSTDTIPGSDLVRPETDAEKITPKVPGTKEPVANTSNLTETEKAKVQKNVEDANKGNFPDGTKVTVGDDGTATITYPDQTDQTKSTDTIPGSDLVRPETDAEKITPKVPGTKEPVANTSNLTETEKAKVQKNVEDANKGNFPDGTKVTVGDDGTATITYPDQTDQTKSTDTIPGSDLVRPETDAEKITPKVPGTKEPVANTSNLTETEKAKVQKNVEDANKGNFPDGTKVTVGDDGTATITYPDQTDQTKSTDTIPGSDLVRPETDAEKITPKVPGTKEPVANTSNLTETEKAKVQKNVEDANKGNFPDGTKVTVGDDGTATITYPDQTDQTKSTDTIPGSDLVRPETDAEKITPKVPGTKEPVANTSNLTETEKAKVQKNVEDANKGNFPDGTKVTVGDDGTATITYKDGSKDTIPGDQLVQGQKGDTTDAGNITPNVPGDKVTVKDPSHLTDDEKNQVKNNVDNANKDKFPAGTEVTVGDDGTTTVTYPDGSKDTIPGDQLVQGQKGDTTDAGNITPNVPGDKVTVKDPSHLTDDEKNQVKNNVDNANKDKFPAGTEVTVGDDGTTTVTYPDGSKDTIPGDQLVQGQKGDTTDAGNITPNVPGDKVTVKDPSHLTDDEKDQVKNNVDNANKDKFPAGTEVTVGDDGTTTVTYPDGSKDTIPGDKVVEVKTDADKNTPNVPDGDKVKVDDPTKLTDDEKNAVKNKVDEANPNLPDGTKVTVGDDGTTTITYPDGSTNTIPGHDLVTGKTDADKYPLNPGQAVDVVDPNHLTQAEQDQVKEAIRTANPTAPIATITVDAAGNVQVTFADGSTTTLQANLHKHVTEATTGSATKPGAGTNGNQMKGATSTNQTATKQQAQQHLPQTGDQPATWAMLSGLGVAFLGLLGLKKKRED